LSKATFPSWEQTSHGGKRKCVRISPLYLSSVSFFAGLKKKKVRKTAKEKGERSSPQSCERLRNTQTPTLVLSTTEINDSLTPIHAKRKKKNKE